jgi:hypothetical protein
VVLRSGGLRFLALMKLRLIACRRAAMAIEDVRDQPEDADKEVKLTAMETYCLADALINAACCLIPM